MAWQPGCWSAPFEAKYQLKGKALFDCNGATKVPEPQLQALLDEGQITGNEMADYLVCWPVGTWSAEFETKYRTLVAVAA